jgi:putative peptidoglycan lipid II flippase
MDAFAVAYRLANLFRRLLAEGAMNAAFIPIFIEYRQEKTTEELWEFARKFFYTLALVSSVVVLLEIILAPYVVRFMAPGFFADSEKWELTVQLTRILAPYLLFVSLAAFLMGVLNSFGQFALPALSPIYFNLAVICASVFSFYVLKEPVYGIAFGVLIGGFLQFACQLPLVKKQGMQFKVGFSFTHPAIRKVGRLLAPSIFGMGIVQLNLLVDSLMASFLREGSVSQIYYADRVMELALGIFVVSLTTVAFPEMSRSATEKNMPELKSTIMFSLRSVAFIAIPATVGLFVLADPIVHVLFERGRFTSLDTERTAVALAYYALGLSFISASKLLVSAFYAIQDTKTPVKVAFVALTANAVLNWVLMHPLKQGGIALATSIAAALSFFQLVFIFQKQNGALDWAKFNKSLIRVLIASVVMGFACLLTLQVFGFDTDKSTLLKATALFGTIGVGILVYLAMTLILRMDEVNFLRRWIPLKPK